MVKRSPPENIEGFLTQIKQIKVDKRKAINLLLDDIMKDIERQEKFIRDQQTLVKEAEQNFIRLSDEVQIFKAAKDLLPDIVHDMGGDVNQEEMGLMEEQTAGIVNIKQIAGVIKQTEVSRLRKLIFRMTKGKALIYFQSIDMSEIDSSVLSEELSPENRETKVVYIIINAGGSNTKERLDRICSSFAGTRLDIPKLSQINEEIERAELEMKDAQSVFERTKSGIRNQLISFDKFSSSNDDESDPDNMEEGGELIKH